MKKEAQTGFTGWTGCEGERNESDKNRAVKAYPHGAYPEDFYGKGESFKLLAKQGV
jgi:hypothetical protein